MESNTTRTTSCKTWTTPVDHLNWEYTFDIKESIGSMSNPILLKKVLGQKLPGRWAIWIVICKMSAILFKPGCVKLSHWDIKWTNHCRVVPLYIDDLVQDCSISIANALEILQSCTKLLVCGTWYWSALSLEMPRHISNVARVCFKNTYEFLNLRALKLSPLNKINIFQCMGKIFVWNFKGTLWNSTQNILPIYWKIWFLYNTEISRALIFKSPYMHFWNAPQATSR